MKKLFLSLVCMTVLFASCGGDNAVKFNDTIIEGVDGAVEKMEKVEDLIYNDEYDDALVYVDTLQKHVSDYHAKITAMSNKSGEEFKARSLEMLDMINNEFIPAYKNSISEYRKADELEDESEMEAKYDAIYNGMTALYEKIEVIEKDIQEIQKVFAKKNNMTLY